MSKGSNGQAFRPPAVIEPGPHTAHHLATPSSPIVSIPRPLSKKDNELLDRFYSVSNTYTSTRSQEPDFSQDEHASPGTGQEATGRLSIFPASSQRGRIQKGRDDTLEPQQREEISIAKISRSPIPPFWGLLSSQQPKPSRKQISKSR